MAEASSYKDARVRRIESEARMASVVEHANDEGESGKHMQSRDNSSASLGSATHGMY